MYPEGLGAGGPRADASLKAQCPGSGPAQQGWSGQLGSHDWPGTEEGQGEGRSGWQRSVASRMLARKREKEHASPVALTGVHLLGTLPSSLVLLTLK